jgi:hypothetical protein
MVGLGGLEPPTSPLSGRRPSQYVRLQNRNRQCVGGVFCIPADSGPVRNIANKRASGRLLCGQPQQRFKDSSGHVQRSVQPLRSGVQRCLKPLQGKAAGSQTGCIYNNLGNRRLSASERIRHKGHYPLYICEGQAGAASRISVCSGGGLENRRLSWLANASCSSTPAS